MKCNKNFKPQTSNFQIPIWKFEAGVFVLYVLCSFLNIVNADEFVYNTHDKKDPFGPPEMSASDKIDMELLAGVKLEGIIWDEENPLAIVNGKVVGIEDEIAGAKIIEITDNEVVFRVGEQDIRLKLRIKEEGEL